MKQGRASSSGPGDRKVEPRPHAVSPAYVADCGIQQIRYTKVPMYEGRGYKAPMSGDSTHRSGSQGRHK